jgi:tellurite resistance protein TehA-like permease
MKRTALPLTFILALLFSTVAVTQLFNFGAADPIVPPPAPTISIISPEDKVYDTKSVLLTFTVNVPSKWGLSVFGTGYSELAPIQYWVDAKFRDQISGDNISEPFSIILDGLSDGRHNVEVTATVSWWSSSFGTFATKHSSSGEKFFTVDATPPKETEPFPTAYSLGFVAAIVSVLLGITVYILKRKD